MIDALSAERRRAMLRTAMGPGIAAALADPQVIEIMVNPDGMLRLDRLGEGRIETGTIYDPAQIERIIRLVASHARTEAHASRLIGSYDSVVAFGQSRALVVWQRIILPDGSSIRIDNIPATDTQGYAGLSDKIDRHTWQLLKGVALATLLGVGTELSFGSTESDLVRAIRESAQQSGARAGDQFVTRSLNIQPTLRVRPGWPLRVVVHKDVVVPGPWRGRHG